MRVGGDEPPPGAPVIRVRTVSIFGATEVKTDRGRRPREPLPPPGG